MQGTAAGLIQPMAMVVMSQVFPREQRGRAMGIYVIGIVLAPALGPTMAGILVDEYSWRDVFLAIVPVCLVAMAAVAVFLPGRDTRPGIVAPRFDGLGFVFLVVFLVCLLSALSNGQREGWSSDLILTLFAAALAAAVAFVVRELTCRMPLLNLRVLANGGFAASCLVAFALGAGIYGSTYIVPLFVQTVQGYTPTRSGLLLMPAGFVLAMASPLGGHLADRLPPWLPIAAGLALFGVSNVLCGGVDIDTSFWSLAGWIVMGRIGLGLITPALNAGALRALPPEQLAQGSGAVNFVRQFGGALGVNLLSVVIDRRTTFHADALAQAVTPATAAASEAVQRLGPMLAHWGNPFGSRMPANAPPAGDGLSGVRAGAESAVARLSGRVPRCRPGVRRRAAARLADVPGPAVGVIRGTAPYSGWTVLWDCISILGQNDSLLSTRRSKITWQTQHQIVSGFHGCLLRAR